MKAKILADSQIYISVLLKCYYDKKQPSRNHFEIMLAVQIFHEEG